MPALLAAGQRLFDCVLMTFLGYDLAVLFKTRADWQADPSDETAYSGVRIRARNA